MSDKFLPDISVGDLAMGILKGMAKNPAAALKPALKESTTAQTNAPDISRVEVPEDYVSKVLGVKTEKSKPQVKALRESSESKLESLVERLASLVSEAKSLMEEMTSGATTTGTIGNNPFAICNNSVGTKKTSKRERCIQKLKRKYGP